MHIARFLPRCALAACAASLAGCDPGVSIAWEKDQRGVADADCVEKALRAVVPKVTRDTYVADRASHGFSNGTKVIQFGYSDPTDLVGYYNLEFAQGPTGLTHYWHGWSKVGTDIPADEQRRVEVLMRRTSLSIATRCGLDFSGARRSVRPD